MKNAIFVSFGAFILGILCAVSVPIYAEFLEPTNIIAREEFQKSFINPSTKNKSVSENTIDELILIELKEMNEKLGNIQYNTFKR